MIELTAGVTAPSGTLENTTTNTAELYSDNDQYRFESAMEAENCDSSSSSDCMGSQFLEGMQQLKSGYDEKVTAINDAVNIGELTVQDVMSLQLEIAKLQMQEELMAKTASKTTQNVDTLLKSQ